MNRGPSARVLQSISHVKILLAAVIESPELFLEKTELVEALKAQGKLSSLHYVDEKYNIESASLNAYKRAAKILFDRGYHEIDELRIAAHIALQSKKDGPKERKTRSVAGLTDQNDDLTKQIENIREDCVHLTKAFNAAVRAAKNLVNLEGADVRQEYWRKEQLVLFSMLSMSRKYEERK